MIGVNEYIDLILKKKKWNRVRLLNELNKLEKKMGDKKTHQQNVTNHLNGHVPFSQKTLVKWEWALGLPKGVLVNMIPKSPTDYGKQELNKYYDLVEKIGREVR